MSPIGAVYGTDTGFATVERVMRDGSRRLIVACEQGHGAFKKRSYFDLPLAQRMERLSCPKCEHDPLNNE